MSKQCLAAGPWTIADDLTVFAADGTPVCVIGDPFEPISDQDRLHAAAIAILPEIIETLGVFFETFAPDDWTPEEYPDVAQAEEIFKCLSVAGYRRAAS
ncbi:hypothetical protein [Ancylobacter mangrovi]|uniref:hypothetical protein n=1 Tax=Ancylobacter mangrovi TaxID=2972472 RepID=UPI002163BDF6|nr:hypothetical protein [Ancylobacter mangrovi]MCS0501573.1 hypothetical protein [Ancylobacter mangrovi]